MLLLRLVEAPVFGARRPITSWITRGVCLLALFWIGLRRKVSGRAMTQRGAAVANHASWLDIFALNAGDTVVFVAKAEVASWPGIGWLARATGTIFIRRDRSQAAAQTHLLSQRLTEGERILFFPEGTSTDGQRVLPFKPPLFAALLAHPEADVLSVQPITVQYHAPPGADPRFYGWWGDMDFAPHLLHVLAAPRQGCVDVTYHAPRKVSAFAHRKDLAAACEADIRAGLEIS